MTTSLGFMIYWAKSLSESENILALPTGVYQEVDAAAILHGLSSALAAGKELEAGHCGALLERE